MKAKTLKRSLWPLIVLLLHFVSTSSLTAKDYTKEVTSYFKAQFPDMNNISFYARETTVNLVTKNRIYALSSADMIPYRTWYVVVDPSGSPLVLSYKNIPFFNRFIKKENLNLKTDYDHLNFIRLFLILAANDEALLRIPPEPGKIKEEYQKLDFSTKIKTSKGKTILTFFSQNISGSVNRWRMSVKNTGEITNFDKTEIGN